MERIPVEVWQNILRLAIACPLLPLDGEYDHSDIQTIAQTTCTLFLEYKQSEQIRTNLRLVCSCWNGFLEGYSDRFVRLSPNAPDGHWPPVKRWDRVVRLEASAGGHVCEASCWPSFYPSRSLAIEFDRQKKMEAAIKDIYLPLLGNRCRAIIYPGRWGSELERLDHVELLNLSLPVADDPAIYLSALKKYTNLRHLQISLPTLINPSSHIELPSLNTLSMFLESDRYGSGVPTPVLPSHIGIWNLPKLHYLQFNSKHANAWDIEVLNLLLGQVGKTIVRFHLGRRLQSEPCTLLVDKLWDLFPSLQYLGIGIYDLLQMPGPPNEHHNPSVNVFVDPFFMVWWRQGPPHELITEFPKRWASGRLGEVRLETTWEKLLYMVREHRRDGQLTLSPFSDTSINEAAAIFDILHTTGKGLTDCDGVPFNNEVRGSILSVAFEAGI